MLAHEDGVSFNGDGFEQGAAVPSNPLSEEIQIKGYTLPSGVQYNANNLHYQRGIYDGNGYLWLVPYNANPVLRVNVTPG
jgi:hypothetical protein